MKATVKQIFNHIQMLNPATSNISSLGSFISKMDQDIADSIRRKLRLAVSVDSLAEKILASASNFSEKQLWVIAFELEKNETWASELGSSIAREEAKDNAKMKASKDKLASNKAGSQSVIDYVKSNGRLLKDYYSFLKSSRQYKREFFSKKFSMESASEFINL